MEQTQQQPSSLLIAYGADRPGILDEVAQYVYERGANISESKLLSLRGTFILMILVHGDGDTITRLRHGLPTLASASRIGVDLRDAEPEVPADASGAAVTFLYRFSAAGSDQAGVLHKLSHLLRALNVNIEDVHSHVAPAKESERPQFTLDLLLSVPRDTPVIKLREYLGTLCGELSIQWELSPA
jgi:glycine cleavage system transcriptional repressor